jgi:hypothetical protein
MKKESIFDLDLEELLKNAKEATDLNNVCKKIVEEANNQLVDEDYIKYNRDWSILANQVVGAEYR